MTTGGNKPPKTENGQLRRCQECQARGTKGGRTCTGCEGSGYVNTRNI